MPSLAEKRTQERIVHEYLVRHINNHGGRFTDWYCGITDDIERRVFDEHNVSRRSTTCRARRCYFENSARKVEKALLEKGCAGGGGGGGDRTVYVYIYRITDNTRQ